jgi:multidrug efflux pump subunit AcrB
VVVENIVRHFHLPRNRGRDRVAVAVEAVSEVGNPTILATFAVIAAVLPMAFGGGLMGRYMRPIPVGASAAMFFSLGIAFMVTPWAAIRMLRRRRGEAPEERDADPAAGVASHSALAHEEDFFTRLYRRIMQPLIERRYWR